MTAVRASFLLLPKACKDELVVFKRQGTPAATVSQAVSERLAVPVLSWPTTWPSGASVVMVACRPLSEMRESREMSVVRG